MDDLRRRLEAEYPEEAPLRYDGPRLADQSRDLGIFFDYGYHYVLCKVGSGLNTDCK